MVIEINELSFNYSQDVQVLHEISLNLESPGLVCIVGPNGAGKSTLIKCINGLLRPGDGSVRIDGKDTQRFKKKELAMKIGYVPPETKDLFSLPVIDAIMLGRHNLQGWRNTDRDIEKVYQIMRLLNIEDLAMRSFNRLSSGQHQRVALARGLAQETEALLLDEPTANLDVKHQIYVTEMLRAISKEKRMLVVMISHDLNTAAKYSDKIVVMSAAGRIHSFGPPGSVITQKTVREVYGIDCEVSERGGVPHVVPGSVISI